MLDQSIPFGIAIETRYHGPTNYKGSRISVRCPDRPEWPKRFYSFDDSASCAHAAAFEQYLLEFNRMQSRPMQESYEPNVLARASVPHGYIYTVNFRLKEKVA